MKILIINVQLRPPPARIWLPLGVGYICRALKNAGYDADLLDLDSAGLSKEETEAFLKNNKYDVVMMGCIVTGYRFIKWLAHSVKSHHPDTKVIVGNTVASSIPELLLTCTDADVAIMGEGDVTIVELLRRIEKNDSYADLEGIYYSDGDKAVANPPRQPIGDISVLEPPDWSLFDLEVYIKSARDSLNEPIPPIPREEIRPMPINTARGCPFRCSFCYQAFQDYPYRRKSIKAIIDEMKYYIEEHNINYFVSADDLTIVSARYADEFSEEILANNLNIYWDACCRSGTFKTEEDVEIAKKMKRAGCMAISFSLESANSDILKHMNKHASPDDFLLQVELLSRAGVPSLTSIVYGYPEETPDTIRATIDCCIEAGLYPSSGYLLPQPGTPMYDYAREHGIIQDEEEYMLRIGDRQDLHINLTKMSDEEFLASVQKEQKRCADALGLDLNPSRLLKTGHYKISKKTGK